jgi:predicted glycosyltransferase
VALGTPAWTTFQGRLGAVDEQLIADGRLRMLRDAADVVFEKRAAGAGAHERIRRDPALLAGLLMGPVAGAAVGG